MTPAEEFRDAARIVREYAGKATAGPWRATFTEVDGHPADREPGWDPDVEDGEPDEGLLQLACGTALPGEDGRYAASYQAQHILAEHGDDMPVDEAAELYGSLRWAALVNPLIGEPLAVVFDSAAMNAEEVGADYQLLELARLIRSQHEAMQGGEPS